jgi:hypothetical protein
MAIANFYQFACALIRLRGFASISLAHCGQSHAPLSFRRYVQPVANARARLLSYGPQSNHARPPLAMRRVVTREFQRFALTSNSENLT